MKKSRKRVFWPKNWSKYHFQKAKNWPEILISGVIYRLFELKMHPKLGLLRPKTMPKDFLNNSKTTLEKSRKWVFWPQNWSKCPPQRAKICNRNCGFLREFAQKLTEPRGKFLKFPEGPQATRGISKIFRGGRSISGSEFPIKTAISSKFFCWGVPHPS